MVNSLKLLTFSFFHQQILQRLHKLPTMPGHNHHDWREDLCFPTPNYAASSRASNHVWTTSPQLESSLDDSPVKSDKGQVPDPGLYEKPYKIGSLYFTHNGSQERTDSPTSVCTEIGIALSYRRISYDMIM